MAEKQRFLDVWIVEANTVYKEVPYTVVLDWIQQGRLLEEDQVRSSGTKDWHRVADVPGLRPYVPKAEPLRPTTRPRPWSRSRWISTGTSRPRTRMRRWT